MFNLLEETLETCRKFWNDRVASRPVEICCLEVPIVMDSSGTIEPFPHSAPHNRAIIQTGSVVACLLLSLQLTHGRGNPLVLTPVLFLAHWLL